MPITFEYPGPEYFPETHPTPEQLEPVHDACRYIFDANKTAHRENYDHPFHESVLGFDSLSDVDDVDDSGHHRKRRPGDVGRTVVELRMCALSADIREEPDWHAKVDDPEQREAWRAKALAKNEAEPRPEWRLTKRMIEYVLDELKGYAELVDRANGIQMGCYERVWRSDDLVPPSVHTRLLETSPTIVRRRGGGSVTRLVDPSLFPLIYGRSLLTSGLVPAAPEHTGEAFHDIPDPFGRDESTHDVSKYGAWVPSDFEISNDGHSARLLSPYINDLDPDRHRDMYPLIEELVALAVPMWERVLSDLRRPLTPLRIETDAMIAHDGRGRLGDAPCIWSGTFEPFYNYPPSMPPMHIWSDEVYRKERNGDPPHRLPESKEKYDGALENIKVTESLGGRTVQVVVRMTDIELSPEQPSFVSRNPPSRYSQEVDGLPALRKTDADWQVEGRLNERIVACFTYFYDVVNVTEPRQAYRAAFVDPPSHHIDANWIDEKCMDWLYGLSCDLDDERNALAQQVGTDRVKPGRCLAWPNLYQRRLPPFHLLDRSRPGRCRMLTLLLVDPSIRIPSASEVLTYQREQVLASLEKLVEFVALPVEIRDLIKDFAAEGTMTREEAEERAETWEAPTVSVNWEPCVWFDVLNGYAASNH